MKRPRRLRFQDRVLLLALAAATPASLLAALLLWQWDTPPLLRWLLFFLITVLALFGALLVRNYVVRPLHSLANVLEALRANDYSVRGREMDPADAVGEIMVEVNQLSRTLYRERLGMLEAGVLLEKVISEVDIAVFAFDFQNRLRLVNRAGALLLCRPAEELAGCSVDELGLTALLTLHSGRIIAHEFPAGAGRWEVRRRSFREDGRPHELLVISELSRALREEERQTWQRLVRVIGHELNSSLAPIQSLAGTLLKLIGREPLPEDWREDARRGLTIIHDRAEALARFMSAYARLARLPPPQPRSFDFAPLVRRVASLHGASIVIEAGPDMTLRLDADQIEQALINLVKNAVEAAGDTGRICVRWRSSTAGRLVVEVEDDGPGFAHTENLWVPFFTTKRTGNGIGLVLSREIVENHGGAISLENRTDARGCIARISLPLQLG